VRQLKVADVDADRSSLIVRRSKGRDERIVPLANATLQILREYWAEHRNREWLFPSRARPKQLATATQPVSERSLLRGLECVLASRRAVNG
jgi:integrase/recombinase XerD